MRAGHRIAKEFRGIGSSGNARVATASKFNSPPRENKRPSLRKAAHLTGVVYLQTEATAWTIAPLNPTAVRATPKWGPGATLQAASRRLAALRPTAALPHLGKALTARSWTKPRFRNPSRRLGGSETEAFSRQKTLTQFGHPFKGHGRASLRSDNCPNIPEDCPKWIGTGVRIRRNPHIKSRRFRGWLKMITHLQRSGHGYIFDR